MIKDRIKDFEQCICLLEKIRDNTLDLDVKTASILLIEKLTELKEVFILSVTYSEVN